MFYTVESKNRIYYLSTNNNSVSRMKRKYGNLHEIKQYIVYYTRFMSGRCDVYTHAKYITHE